MLKNISAEMGFSGMQSFIFVISFTIMCACILIYNINKEHKKEISKLGWVSLGVVLTDIITPFIPIVACLILIAIPIYNKYKIKP